MKMMFKIIILLIAVLSTFFAFDAKAQTRSDTQITATEEEPLRAATPTETLTIEPTAVETQPLSPTSTIQIQNTNEGKSNVKGDIDRNNKVDVLDFDRLKNVFGSSDADSDINSDGTVNVLDYTLLSNNFGKSA